MREDSTRRRAHIEALLAFVVPILLLAPFANKAYHIDDPLSLWTAQHILQDPIRFFDYEVNWTGVPGSASIIIKNPPLAMYYMALVGAVAGWGEAPMHLAFFLFAGLTGFGAYLLARRFCSDPLLAAGIAVLSPAVLVSASNVMTTIAMVALYVLAIEAWLRALDTNRAAWYVAAASLIIASTLAKYFGISAVPLLFAYTPFIGGEPLEVLQIFLFSIVGIYALAGAMEGYLEGPVNMVGRVVLTGAGLSLLFPYDQVLYEIAGLVVVITVFLITRRSPAIAAPAS